MAGEIVIRRFTEEALPECLDVYRSNESGGLVPAGYEEMFVSALRSPSVLPLVAVVDQRVVACGNIDYLPQQKAANLSFGLVHPAFQRRRIGSMMLLTRLGLIPLGDNETCSVYLYATANSVSFFRNLLGFGEIRSDVDELGNRMFALQMLLTPKMQEMGRRLLGLYPLTVEENLAIPPTANPLHHGGEGESPAV